MFEATHTSGGYTSSVSIDDISFTDSCDYNKEGTHGNLPTQQPPPSGNCPDGTYACLGSSCYSENQRCDFINSCGDQQQNGLSSDEYQCGEFHGSSYVVMVTDKVFHTQVDSVHLKLMLVGGPTLIRLALL